MHAPMTQAFAIPNPFAPRYEWGTRWSQRPSLAIIWHVDPEKGGSDDSCDWFGKRRRLNPREKALAEAYSELSHVIGNAPFYPHPRLYGHDPHGEGNQSPKREMDKAFYAWRRKGRIRWHPRWHVHHWSLRIFPVLHFKRWAFSRCTGCGGRFTWGYSPVSGSWYGSGPRWFRNGENVYHGECFPSVESKAQLRAMDSLP